MFLRPRSRPRWPGTVETFAFAGGFFLDSILSPIGGGWPPALGPDEDDPGRLFKRGAGGKRFRRSDRKTVNLDARLGAPVLRTGLDDPLHRTDSSPTAAGGPIQEPRSIRPFRRGGHHGRPSE